MFLFCFKLGKEKRTYLQVLNSKYPSLFFFSGKILILAGNLNVGGNITKVISGSPLPMMAFPVMQLPVTLFSVTSFPVMQLPVMSLLLYKCDLDGASILLAEFITMLRHLR